MFKSVKILSVSGRKRIPKSDRVISESNLDIFLNQSKIATILYSPRDLKFLAIGFLASEGLINKTEDVISIKASTDSRIYVQANLPESKTIFNLLGSSGARLSKMKKLKPLNKKANSDISLTTERITSLMRQMENKSLLFKSTGGAHAAALSNGREIILFNEDIGRHNAIDKVLGEAFLKNISFEDKIILTSGRISTEILAKVAGRFIPIIISKAAPTDKAVVMAKRLGITLIGFVRDKRMNIYAHPDRVNFN